jgi:adenylate cyclase class 1
MEYQKIINENKSRFQHFNSLKYQRFQDLLPNVNVRRVINAIPLLLCVNHRKLPGFVEGEVPYGITGYSPDEETKKFIRAKYPTARAEIDHAKRFIQMLAVMGSVGTVAYNKKSDFDYWVCVNSRSVPKEQLANFMQKVDAIQKWAAREVDVPVHLFVNDIDSIRNNIFAEDEEEAFGSTVGAVLKDEFFRSSIIIAGKIPFWWVVPHFVKDEEYDSFFNRLPEEMREYEFVDLGNLFEISKEDFLGSALFQIIKSLGNPFKSIIKIGVLEKYLFGEGYSLLSQKIKMNLLRGSLDDTMLDAYLFMFREVYDYYGRVMKDENLLRILKQNLYLKVDPQITRYAGVKDQKNIPYKVKVMLSYVKEWKWTMKDIKDLDNFDNWDFNRVMEFWDLVTKFMLLSYQNISQQLPTLNLKQKVSESDFMLLSRKIKTHFRREKDKIDQLITFKDTPSESILYLEPAGQGIQNVEWRLYKRDRSEQDAFQATTIKTDTNLLKLLTWCALNNIYDPTFTRLNIQSGYTRINQNAVMELMNHIVAFFSSERTRIKNEYFLRETFRLLNMVILNFNIEGADDIKTIHHIYLTSWGESYIREYSSENDLAGILVEILGDGLNLRRPFDGYVSIVTPESYKKHYKSVITIFREAYRLIVEDTDAENARFVTRLGDKYLSFTRDKSGLACETFANLINLLASNSLKPRPSIKYRFFGDDPQLEKINAIYENHRPFSLTIAYEETGERVILHIVNETGNIFVFVRPPQMKDPVLLNLYDFCNIVTKQVNEQSGRERILKQNLKIFKMKTDKFGAVSFTDMTKLIEAEFLGKFSMNNTLCMSVSYTMGDTPFYDFTFPDKVKSGFMTTKEIYSVAEKIRELRKQGIDVLNIIKDISITCKNRPFTHSTQYFMEKFKMEFLVDTHLKQG